MLLSHLEVLRHPQTQKPFTVKTVFSHRSFKHGQGAETDIIFGLVKSGQRTYPIIQGILYLKSDKYRQAVRLMETGQISKAADMVFDFPKGINKLVKVLKPWGRLDRWLFGFGRGTTPLFERFHWWLRLMMVHKDARPWLQYLLNRDHNPTFYHAITNTSVVTPGLALDVGSGTGDFLPFLQKAAGEFNVVATDNSFWNLYFSAFTNPHVSHICSDITEGIFFKNRSLQTLTFNDCFHCFGNKQFVANEVIRVLQTTGLAIFCHVHNSADQKFFAGEPIAFKKFRSLFAKQHVYAVSEKTLHQQLVLKRGKLASNDMRLSSSNLKVVSQAHSYVAYVSPKPLKGTLQLRHRPSVSLNYREDDWLIANS